MKPSDKKQLKAIGERIRSLREKQNISQDQLAYECETDRSFISRVENGHKNITATTLLKIATALNVPVGELFDSK